MQFNWCIDEIMVSKLALILININSFYQRAESTLKNEMLKGYPGGVQERWIAGAVGGGDGGKGQQGQQPLLSKFKSGKAVFLPLHFIYIRGRR